MSDDSFHIRAADQAAFAHEKGVHAQTMNQQMALRDSSRSATLFSEAFSVRHSFFLLQSGQLKKIIPTTQSVILNYAPHPRCPASVGCD